MGCIRTWTSSTPTAERFSQWAQSVVSVVSQKHGTSLPTAVSKRRTILVETRPWNLSIQNFHTVQGETSATLRDLLGLPFCLLLETDNADLKNLTYTSSSVLTPIMSTFTQFTGVPFVSANREPENRFLSKRRISQSIQHACSGSIWFAC